MLMFKMCFFQVKYIYISVIFQILGPRGKKGYKGTPGSKAGQGSH